LSTLNFNIFQILQFPISPFPHGTNALSSIKSFRLWGWSPNIQTARDLYRFTFQKILILFYRATFIRFPSLAFCLFNRIFKNFL